jgi:S-DNA-T family DNA segregation ATPase FtsK/SpoIIIE
MFHGILEYYEPELHEVRVSREDLEALFSELVQPILCEISGKEIPARSTGNAQQPLQRRQKKKIPVEAADLSYAIQKCYASFKMAVDVMGANAAPQLIRYMVKPTPGVKVVSLANRAEDLRVALSLPQTPIIEPVKGAVAIDIPKETADIVHWHDVVEAPAYVRNNSPVSFPVGLGVDDHLIVADFADANMCHALVAGASGSGKSEFLKCLVASLIAKNSPETLKLTIIDPKMLTFGGLSGDIPHLSEPVITDVKSAIPCLCRASEEMETRYQTLLQEGFENLSERFRAGRRDMNFSVIVFDEFADLILSGKEEKKEFENLVAKLAQKGRAAGIHIVLSTQRPDRTVLTGLVKANLPLKICMRVLSATNSSIVLDQTGAEKLLGRGDLLCDRGRGIERAQSPYITQDELRNIANPD